MEKLNTLSDTRDDFIHTLYSFAIPALVAAGEGQADIVAKLQVESLFHIIKAKLQGIKEPSNRSFKIQRAPIWHHHQTACLFYQYNLLTIILI